jgi:hypothetical protein
MQEALPQFEAGLPGGVSVGGGCLVDGGEGGDESDSNARGLEVVGLALGDGTVQVSGVPNTLERVVTDLEGSAVLRVDSHVGLVGLRVERDALVSDDAVLSDRVGAGCLEDAEAEASHHDEGDEAKEQLEAARGGAENRQRVEATELGSGLAAVVTALELRSDAVHDVLLSLWGSSLRFPLDYSVHACCQRCNS